MGPPIRGVHVELPGRVGEVFLTVFQNDLDPRFAQVDIPFNRAAVLQVVVAAAGHTELFLNLLVPPVVFMVAGGDIFFGLGRDSKETEHEAQQRNQSFHGLSPRFLFARYRETEGNATCDERVFVARF